MKIVFNKFIRPLPAEESFTEEKPLFFDMKNGAVNIPFDFWQLPEEQKILDQWHERNGLIKV